MSSETTTTTTTTTKIDVAELLANPESALSEIMREEMSNLIDSILESPETAREVLIAFGETADSRRNELTGLRSIPKRSAPADRYRFMSFVSDRFRLTLEAVQRLNVGNYQTITERYSAILNRIVPALVRFISESDDFAGAREVVDEIPIDSDLKDSPEQYAARLLAGLSDRHHGANTLVTRFTAVSRKRSKLSIDTWRPV